MATDRRRFLKQAGTGAAGLGVGALLAPWKAEGGAPEAAGPGKNDPAGAPAYVSPTYRVLPLGAVKPQGWLLHQLQIMRDGTTGHLDEVHEKVRDRNGWLGGQGDGWEETPYWLDGATPLAWLLEDDILKRKVLKYIDWTLDHQRPSGYFGPVTKAERGGVEITTANPEAGEDWWPKMIMLKVLQQFYTATEDKRVIPFMEKYFRYQLAVLARCPLGHWTQWAASRGTENIAVVQWLYGITGDSSLLRLAELLESQTFPWSEWFEGRDWVIDAAAHQDGRDWMHRHGVNVAMALKAPALHYQRTGEERYRKILATVLHDLMTLHGLPNGMFSADEDLHGNNPVQGVELCAIVEAMFSMEQAVSVFGDPRYMDALERMAYNALPTQTTDDYNNKQYFQVANQVQVCRGVFDFSLPFDRRMNNVFGMRSGYTCCLANMHQGWTKFTRHLWYGTATGGLAALHYAPSEVTARVGSRGTAVTITEKTAYPFEETVVFVFSVAEAVEFPFQFRIPGWCREAGITVNGKPYRRAGAGELVTVSRLWAGGDTLTLELPMAPVVTRWGRNSRAVERGPLVYALKLPERWERGVDEKEGDYYSVFAGAPWNYGLLKAAVGDPAGHMTVKQLSVPGREFVWNLSHAPVEITVAAKQIPGWQLAGGVAPQPVNDRSGVFKGDVSATTEQITLIPYGCSKVRVVAFPVVK